MPTSPRRPISPEAASIIRMMQAGRPSRRSLLGGLGALGLGAALSACSGGSRVESTPVTSSAAERPVPAHDVSDTERMVRWSNWPLYLDYNEANKSNPTLAAFRAQTGIEVGYFEDVEDNNAYVNASKDQLRRGEDTGKDLIVLTDWMAGRLVHQGWVQKLDKSRIPNARGILPTLRNVDYDRGRDYSLTWQSGYTGIGWHKANLKALTGSSELKSVDDLWNPKLDGRVEVLSEMRDTIGLIMMSQGTPVDKPFLQEKYDNSVNVLEKHLADGRIRTVKGNSYKEDLISGDAVAVIGWSGDIFQLNSMARIQDPNLDQDPFGFQIPESGGIMFSDNLLVPDGSAHKANVEKLINYYYDPVIAAQVARSVQYVCPVQGAQAAMSKMRDVPSSLIESPYIFPDNEFLAKVHFFRTLTTEEDNTFTAAFQQILGA